MTTIQETLDYKEEKRDGQLGDREDQRKKAGLTVSHDLKEEIEYQSKDKNNYYELGRCDNCSCQWIENVRYLLYFQRINMPCRECRTFSTQCGLCIIDFTEPHCTRHAICSTGYVLCGVLRLHYVAASRNS